MDAFLSLLHRHPTRFIKIVEAPHLLIVMIDLLQNLMTAGIEIARFFLEDLSLKAGSAKISPQEKNDLSLELIWRRYHSSFDSYHGYNAGGFH